MLGAPDFIDNPNVVFNNGRFFVDKSVPEKEKRKLKKEILRYRKKQLEQLNKSTYCGYLKMNKQGDFYLDKLAPDELKTIFKGR